MPNMGIIQNGQTLEALHWIASSLDDLRELPDDVQDTFGYALQRAQEGARHGNAKSLKGFGGAGVLEIVDNHEGNSYRAVYTVKFAMAIYVLHVFLKKSKKGIATPASDLDLIRKRLKVAADDYEEQYRSKKS
jgi:phage-related protein